MSDGAGGLRATETVVYVWCLRNEPYGVVWREGPVVDDGEGGRCRGRGLKQHGTGSEVDQES